MDVSLQMQRTRDAFLRLIRIGDAVLAGEHMAVMSPGLHLLNSLLTELLHSAQVMGWVQVRNKQDAHGLLLTGAVANSFRAYTAQSVRCSLAQRELDQAARHRTVT